MIRLFEDKSHVEAYFLHRPTWPKEVVAPVLRYLNKIKLGHCIKDTDKPGTWWCKHMVDVGCGSGQSTPLYAPYCEKITAIDPSEEQIKIAKANHKFENIKYVTGDGEKIPVPDNSVELICAAQSVHWLDWNKYFKECKRVLMPHGCMATYGYAFPKLHFPDKKATDECNELLQGFFKKCLFHPRRRHVDNRYVEFFEMLPCENKIRDDSLKIERSWTLEQLKGYIESWSGYRKLQEEIASDEVLKVLMENIKQVLNKSERKDKKELEVEWDIFIILSSRPS